MSKVIAMSKQGLIDLVGEMMYDGWIHLPESVVDALYAEAAKDKEWKAVCDENCWPFPTKENTQ